MLPAERARITAAGGYIEYGRVNGVSLYHKYNGFRLT